MTFGGALFLTILLVVLFALVSHRRAEGFTSGGDGEGDAGAILSRMISSAQRIGRYLADPENWKENTRRARMTPVEMAREYLRSARASDS
jgi:hypothetical protein